MESSGSSSALSVRATGARPLVEVLVGDGFALVNGSPVWLTRREFAVLRYLVARSGRPVPRAEIRRAVWGEPVSGFKDRSVEVHVVRLRRKLAAGCSKFTYIHTHHNVGYRFEPEAASCEDEGRRPKELRP